MLLGQGVPLLVLTAVFWPGRTALSRSLIFLLLGRFRFGAPGLVAGVAEGVRGFGVGVAVGDISDDDVVVSAESMGEKERGSRVNWVPSSSCKNVFVLEEDHVFVRGRVGAPRAD